MKYLCRFVALIAACGSLVSAFPASTPQQSTSALQITSARSLTKRAGNDNPIFPNPIINPLILYLVAQHLLIGDAVFEVDIADNPGPIQPVQQVDTGPGVDSIINSIQMRAAAGLGGRVNRITTFLAEGRPVVVQISFAPIGQTTWNHIVGVAGGVENVRTFIQNNVQTALNEGSQDREFAFVVVTNADSGEGVQLGVLYWQVRQPQ